MIDELNAAIREYRAKWQKLVEARKNRAFFEELRPIAIGWKAQDLADFEKRFAELREHAEQIHLGWVNERWLATICLRNIQLAEGIVVVKLMQRRPGSTDATGLDHLDFYLGQGVKPETGDSSIAVKDILTAEPDLRWSEENNGSHCKWLSIWFDDTEAKIRSDTVLDVCIEELQDCRKKTCGDPA